MQASKLMGGFIGRSSFLLVISSIQYNFKRAWKTESADEWSYQKGIEGGWIPKDPTERAFPNLCG